MSNLWSDTEIEMLKAVYGSLDTLSLRSTFPNRSHKAITQKAFKLGLQRPKSLTNSSDWFQYKTILGNLSETEKGYLAGLIDGDGYIGMTMSTNGTCRIRVNITNTDKPMIDWLLKKIPIAKARIYRRQTTTWKTCYSWNLCGSRKAIQFLKEIAPYLIVKRPLAKRLSKGYLHLSKIERLELLNFVKNFNRNGHKI